MKKKLFALALMLITGSLMKAQTSSVSLREGTIDIPTYMLDKPEIAPIFDCDYSYQRARRSVYPYPLNDNMTRNKKVVTYKAIYMENKYIELCVLPEIGGRLFYAKDKTDGYDIFYHQDVIKPANVGMTGAWISGGVEWNVFHHHRATSHTPCDYKLVENSDGSKTIWLGETELRHRMSWAIGITLHPDKSYIEISGNLINSTPNNNSMLYWSNVSTKVDDNYQIIFPQSVDYGTFHCKESFCHWPITNESFRGIDEYANGIDASWWKNHPASNSIFIYDQKEDYIAGYDHGQNAGTMLVGNHNIIKGGKFWLWGPNSEWDTKILTDNAGHYCELMVGAYSDNQPDYNWSIPYEVKKFSHYWYGLNKIGGVKAGCKEAAMNMDINGNKVNIGVNVTEKLDNLKLVLMDKDKKVYDETLSLNPSTPFLKTISLKKAPVSTDLTLSLLGSDGKVMLSYTPRVKDNTTPLPEIVHKPLLPSEIENNEECYLVGLRNLQFFNPFINPTDYFLEVLKRDPSDTRCNTQMGIWCRIRGDYENAKKYLRTAIKRQTKDYTRPKDCQAMYNLGLILKQEKNYDAAIDTLYRAVWSYEYNSAANFQLAQIYACQNNYEMALDRLNESIIYNGNNFSSLNLKASILRQTGKKNEAKEIVDRVLKNDPLNHYATYEKMLLTNDNSFYSLMRDIPESYIELAIDYKNNGYNEIAKDLLKYIDSKVNYPTAKMYLGYYSDEEGDKNSARDYYKKALELPVDYCNVFRLETIDVLEKAKEYCPDNYKIYYYLGNLYCDKQSKLALMNWNKCTELNPDFGLAWRNIGWAEWHHNKNMSKALDCYNKAIELELDNALYLEEICQVFEAKGEDVKKRYDLLKSKHDVCVKRYYPLASEVITGTFVGDYDYVLKLLKDCYFPTREGVANFHDVYVDALLMSGIDKLNKKSYNEAIALFEKCFEFPDNHQVFVVDKRTPRDAQIYYYLGKAYEEQKSMKKAKEQYKLASQVNTGKTDYRLWQALAMKKIGKNEIANAMLNKLYDDGKASVVDRVINFYGAEGTTGSTKESVNSLAYYTMGLAQFGMGNNSEAGKLFKKSIDLKIDNLWPNYMYKLVNGK